MTSAEHEFQEAAYSTALIRSLQHGGVKFLRFLTVDVCNNVRCKAVPIDYLLRNDAVVTSLNCLVSVATVCYAGLPFYGDSLVQDSGMNARNQIIIKPDLFTLRVLPYAPKTAMVLGTLHNQYSKELSPFCTRGLLAKIVKDAAEKHNIAFVCEEAGACLFS
jgi:glutamine synthetase